MATCSQFTPEESSNNISGGRARFTGSFKSVYGMICVEPLRWKQFREGMLLLEVVFFFFLSSIWTLLTVIYQQGVSPSSCLLFIRVHGGVTRREASGRSSAAWRVLPSPFLQVFCRAVLNPCNFLPHTDITGEKQSPGEHPWSQYAHVSSYLSNPRLQTQ